MTSAFQVSFCLTELKHSADVEELARHIGQTIVDQLGRYLDQDRLYDAKGMVNGMPKELRLTGEFLRSSDPCHS